MQTQKTTAKTGFTLVELLVVIAIIAVLAVVGFSVAPKMMKKAKQTRSMGNMRQVAIMMNAYAAENGGKLPAPREDNSGNNGSTPNPDRPSNWHWHQAIIEEAYPDVPIWKIVGDREWWKEADPIVLNPQFKDNDAFQPWYPGYAMNFGIAANVLKTGGWFAQSRHRTHLSSIPDPALTPLIVPHWDWHTSNFLSGTALTSDKRSDDFLIDGKLNITFVDGHSELIRFADSNGTRLANSEYTERDLHKMPKL